MVETQLISLRLRTDILKAVDRMASLENRSRSQVIALALEERCVKTEPARKTKKPKKPAVEVPVSARAVNNRPSCPV